MPFQDRTGPQGQGPMTGRGAGLCAGANTTAPSRGFGRGRGGARFGRGTGFGRGRGGWGQGFGFAQPYAPATLTPEQEVSTLKAQAAQLQDSLQYIKDRLSTLEK